MLAFHSGQERTESSWTSLVSKVGGLHIHKFWRPPSNDGEGIVELHRSMESRVT